MATHSSILAWRIPWTEEPGGCRPRVRTELDSTEVRARMRACLGTALGMANSVSALSEFTF